jgi:hypothetical protein
MRDRVIQVYALVYMVSTASTWNAVTGATELDPGLLPPLYVAYQPNPPKAPGFHTTIFAVVSPGEPERSGDALPGMPGR